MDKVNLEVRLGPRSLAAVQRIDNYSIYSVEGHDVGRKHYVGCCIVSYDMSLLEKKGVIDEKSGASR